MSSIRQCSSGPPLDSGRRESPFRASASSPTPASCRTACASASRPSGRTTRTRSTSSASTGTTTRRVRGIVAVPEHVVLPRELTGVDARIVVALGDRFPMIDAHKVLAAYGCLAPRLVTGQFDPTRQPRRLALDRQLLPRRRRDLAPHGLPRRRRAPRGHEPRAVRLARATGSPIRTTSSGRRAPRATSRRSTTAATSSRSIPENVIFNQFAEFGNHIVHYLATGRALGRVFESLQARGAGAAAARVRLRNRLRRDDRAPATT